MLPLGSSGTVSVVPVLRAPSDPRARRFCHVLFGFRQLEEAEFRLRVFALGTPMSILLAVVSLSFNLACYFQLPITIRAYLAFSGVDACFCLLRLIMCYCDNMQRKADSTPVEQHVGRLHVVMQRRLVWKQRAGALTWLAYNFATVLLEGLLESQGVERAFDETDPRNLVVISYVIKAFGTGLVHGVQGMSQLVALVTFTAVVIGLIVMISIFKRMTIENEGTMLIVPGVLGFATSVLLDQALRKAFEWELGGRAALHDRMESLCVEKERLEYERAFAQSALERYSSPVPRAPHSRPQVVELSPCQFEERLASSAPMSTQPPASTLGGSALERQGSVRQAAERPNPGEGSAVSACGQLQQPIAVTPASCASSDESWQDATGFAGAPAGSVRARHSLGKHGKLAARPLHDATHGVSIGLSAIGLSALGGGSIGGGSIGGSSIGSRSMGGGSTAASCDELACSVGGGSTAASCDELLEIAEMAGVDFRDVDRASGAIAHHPNAHQHVCPPKAAAYRDSSSSTTDLPLAKIQTVENLNWPESQRLNALRLLVQRPRTRGAPSSDGGGSDGGKSSAATSYSRDASEGGNMCPARETALWRSLRGLHLVRSPDNV